jgi:hypothetical protein
MGKKRTERIERPEQKAAREAAARGYAARQKRNQVLLWGGVLVAVLATAAFAYRSYQQARLLDAVTTATYPAGQHMAGPITHTENPPVGGTHNVAWQNCGIYNEPIHNEHAVHSLEHGAVWITYRPDLPADQVEILRTVASDDHMLLSPYPGLDAPVVASSWNHQIRLDGASDPRLRAFIEEYKNNPETTPEFGASCAGAISTTASTTASLTDPTKGMGLLR